MRMCTTGSCHSQDVESSSRRNGSSGYRIRRLRLHARVLREYGNVSSATVPLRLAARLEHGHAPAGDWGIMAALDRALPQRGPSPMVNTDPGARRGHRTDGSPGLAPPSWPAALEDLAMGQRRLGGIRLVRRQLAYLLDGQASPFASWMWPRVPPMCLGP